MAEGISISVYHLSNGMLAISEEDWQKILATLKAITQVIERNNVMTIGTLGIVSVTTEVVEPEVS